MVLPLRIDPDRPRITWDAWWLNSICKHASFRMDPVGKEAKCPGPGAYKETLDHKSVFHRVGLDTESWTYFRFCWQGIYYVFTVL